MSWKTKALRWLLGVILVMGESQPLAARSAPVQQAVPVCEAVPQAVGLLQA